MAPLLAVLAAIERWVACSRGLGWLLQINKERYISKMFLRGDSVIIVLKNPTL